MGKNKEKVRLRRAAYYAKNKDDINLKIAIWRDNNKIRVAGMKQRWRECNRDKAKASVRKWSVRNPSKARLSKHKYRAALRANGGALSSDIVQKLMRFQNGKCVACGANLKKVKYHIDHIVPIAKGGPNVDANVQLLCKSCNLRKNAKDPIRFMQEMGFLL